MAVKRGEDSIRRASLFSRLYLSITTYYRHSLRQNTALFRGASGVLRDGQVRLVTL
jgi:hypothetical protein